MSCALNKILKVLLVMKQDLLHDNYMNWLILVKNKQSLFCIFTNVCVMYFDLSIGLGVKG